MWGVAVAMPYIFVENGEWKWYNEMKNCKRKRMDFTKVFKMRLQK